MRRSRKNAPVLTYPCVADWHAATNERIVEVSLPKAHGGGETGCLLSFRTLVPEKKGGKPRLVVSVYSISGDVYVARSGRNRPWRQES